MYKNQLQELAQRSCFGLPSYSCIREGPDHAPRFKATVNFNGETFESPTFFSTLRHAEHAAAEVALNMLAMKGPSRALTARVLDETGVYKNLLQETAHRAGLNLPTYTTVRSGPGHVPSFSCTVELGGMTFVGQPSRTKKQAQKNAAMSAWSSLRKMTKDCASSSSGSSTPSLETKASEEQEQAIVARFLTNLQPPNPKTKNKSTGHVPRGKNLYPVQNWRYSSFSPEMFVYNLLEEQKILQQQQQMMMMTMLPYPRVFQVLHYRPESYQYFPVAPRISIGASRPYFSNQSASDPSCSSSTVIIQEMLDEKTDEMVGQPSAESRMVGPTPASGSRPETRHPQTHAPVRMRSTGGGSDPSFPRTVRVVGPVPVSGSSPKTRHPQTYAPVRMRTGGGSDPCLPRTVRVVGPAPVSGSRPETRHPQTYAPIRMRSLLAPPVRIRSVVPVCSAPPSTIPRQGRLEKKVNEVDEACSELGDLQL